MRVISRIGEVVIVVRIQVSNACDDRFTCLLIGKSQWEMLLSVLTIDPPQIHPRKGNFRNRIGLGKTIVYGHQAGQGHDVFHIVLNFVRGRGFFALQFNFRGAVIDERHLFHFHIAFIEAEGFLIALTKMLEKEVAVEQ
jgi:hypothetical protein